MGRHVLLTGAAGGIGQVMTAALLADGHSVAAIDRDAAALERLAARTADARARLHPIVADLQSERGCETAVEAATARFGAVDAVVNNAGIGMSSIRPDAEARYPGIDELTPEIYDAFFAIFVRAPVALARATVPTMRQRRWGRIVNNTTSYLTMLRVLPYGAAKAAFESLSAVWATELEGSGITVNVLVPGGPTAWVRPRAGWCATRRKTSRAAASRRRAGMRRCRPRRRRNGRAARSAGQNCPPTPCGCRVRRVGKFAARRCP